jgi:hypothetical protein
MHVAHVVWIYCVSDYRATNASVALVTKARYSCDGRTCVDTLYAGSLCDGLFKPLKSHHCTTAVNNFIWLYIYLICVVWLNIFIYIAKRP